ncbi:hypothetical protein MFIFM68171_02108 [Madurella fahalii]|uniref:Uncharacterized protein n=1 Tax=Madurella fahalii TaxID=1157608 RepID=A0ABQ0G2B0_9PEZI
MTTTPSTAGTSTSSTNPSSTSTAGTSTSCTSPSSTSTSGVRYQYTLRKKYRDMLKLKNILDQEFGEDYDIRVQ